MRRIKRFDPYEREYGPTARRHSSAMSRYYASVSRAIKRALTGKSQVLVRLPKDYEWGRGARPRTEVIAAGAGVLALRFEKVEHDPKTYRAEAVTFRVVR